MVIIQEKRFLKPLSKLGQVSWRRTSASSNQCPRFACFQFGPTSNKMVEKSPAPCLKHVTSFSVEEWSFCDKMDTTPSCGILLKRWVFCTVADLAGFSEHSVCPKEDFLK